MFLSSQWEIFRPKTALWFIQPEKQNISHPSKIKEPKRKLLKTEEILWNKAQAKRQYYW